MKSLLNRFDELTRRRFMSHAALGCLGVGAMPLLERAAQAAAAEETFPLRPATAKNVIYLYMSGGMTHLDTLDPKPGHENQGPVEAIKTSADGVLLSQHLPHMAKHMHHAAVINSLSSTQGAHAQGRYFMHTSYTMRGTIKHPSLGAWLMKMSGKRNETLPGHVAIGNSVYQASGGFFESKHAPLPIGDPDSGLKDSARASNVNAETFNRRVAAAEEMNRAFAAKFDQKQVRAYTDMYDEAIKLMSSKDLEAFDLSKESDAMRAAYGSDSFGRGCLLARRLVEHGVRFVEVTYGGWDTHNQNFDAMEEKCPTLDRAVAALIGDLEARGMLQDTLVVLTTEFGRTPKIVTERMGRNHYPKAFSAMLAGGGVKGGLKYGKTDAGGEEVIENKVEVPDFNATIAHALGLPIEHVVFSPSQRPFTVAHKGKPITELFA